MNSLTDKLLQIAQGDSAVTRLYAQNALKKIKEASIQVLASPRKSGSYIMHFEEDPTISITEDEIIFAALSTEQRVAHLLDLQINELAAKEDRTKLWNLLAVKLAECMRGIGQINTHFLATVKLKVCLPYLELFAETGEIKDPFTLEIIKQAREIVGR